MAGNIKGITIEIGGDTTQLDKALSDINGSSRSLQSELRQVDKLLKLDDSNIVLCQQKEELLTQAVSATKDKLDILKEAEAQVQEQFENGEVSEEQYRALERQIAQTEIQLNTYEQQLDAVKNGSDEAEAENKELEQSFDKMGDEAKEAGEEGETGITTMADALAAAAIAKLIDEIKDALVDLADQWSDSTAAIVEGTGATGKNLEDLQDSLTNVFSRVTDSNATMQDTANVLAEVNTRTGLTGEGLEDLTLNIMEFAEHCGVDATDAVDNIANVMKRWGIETKDSTKLLDILTVANQSCKLSVDDITKMLTDNKVQFDILGYSVEDATALIVSLADAGVDTTSVMSGMKKAINVLSETTDDVPGAFNDMISSISKCDSVADALNLQVGETGKTVKDVFGAKAAQEMCDAIQSGNFELGKWQEVLKNSDGALASTAEAANTLQDKWATASNNMSLALNEAFTPAISAVSGALAEVLTWLGKAIQSSPVLQAVVTALAVALGGLAAALGISALINLVTTAMGALNTAFLACPITWIVLAIAALVAVFLTLWNNCDGFRQFWLDLWENVKAAFQAACDFLEPAIEAIKQWFSDAWEAIKAVWDELQPYFTAAWETIKAVFSVVAETLGAFFTEAWDFIKSIWDTGLIQQYFGTIWENIKLIFSAAKQVLGSFFKNAWEAIKAVWDAVSGYFKLIWETIKGIFAVVKAVLSGDFKGAWEAIKGIWDAVSGYFSTLWNSIKTIFSSVTSFFKTAFTGAWNAVKGVFSNWGSFFGNLWNTIKDKFTSIGTSIANAISGAVKSGINGVISSIESIINGGINLINGAINLINKIPGVSIGKMGLLSLPRLWRGGALEEGGAIVAEAGPELIQMVNGRAIVTPLSSTAQNNNIERVTGKTGNTFTQNVNITSAKELSPAETARQTRNATRAMIAALQRG